MSRAFTKEDGDQHGDDLPERPVPPGPNYVTPAGKAALVSRVTALAAERSRLLAGDTESGRDRRAVERDLRYYEARLNSAVVVDPALQEPGVVRFGAEVEAVEPSGALRRFRIVGHDEADAASGTVSWSSPLAAAVLGAKTADMVEWERPEGTLRLRIESVRYPS
ncbi:MAG: GreA/GreB family elongation factor [Elusimicrobia bacterium]|nr:GreA/GreB family elongation factor [Elusimicrobiota bacterium]